MRVPKMNGRRGDSAHPIRNFRLWNRHSDEAGFALLEVVVGFSLFCVIVLATSSGSVASLVSASVAHQRFVASTLVSQDVASVTALPFADLTAGLNPTADSLSNDPNIQVVGSTYVLKLTNATLATSNTKTSDPPLVPHISTVNVVIPYKVATYPETSASGVVTLVVIVSWTSAAGQASQLVGESQIAAP